MLSQAFRLSALIFKRPQGFLFGLFFGFVLSAAGTALSANEEGTETFTESVLYSIALLAIDTEKNAANIVELENRLDELEEALEKQAVKQE